MLLLPEVFTGNLYTDTLLHWLVERLSTSDSDVQGINMGKLTR